MPKVSIILPIYNVEQYLVECLNSVCGQTLHDIEIICVNDGSTDSSLEIVNRYAEKDSRIVVITGPNGGYGKAMNKGLDRATGEYIGIVEPDDYVAITMYEDLYAIAAQNGLDFVKADFYRFGHNDNGDIEMKYNRLDGSGTRYGELLDPSEDPSAIKFIMNTWSGIYKRDFIEKYHIRHNETPGASFQDNGFFFQTMVRARRAMIVNTPYYRNRRDNPNSSVKSESKVYCINVEYDYIKDLLMRDRDVWERFKAMYSWKKFHSYLFTVSRISFEFKLTYIRRMGAEFKRAYENGDFAKEDFTNLEWEKLTLMMSSPDEYFHRYVVATATEQKLQRQLKDAQAKLQKAQKQLKDTQAKLRNIESSRTYKTGVVVLYIPKKVKKLAGWIREKRKNRS